MSELAVVQQLKHVKQIEALNDPTRFKFWLAGRRGGKTVAIVEDILESLANCPAGGEIFYIGPTNGHAIELIWEKLEERLDELRWKYKPRISKQRFEFSRGRKIYVIGAEKIRRIRGHKVWRAYLDEVAFFEVQLSDVWKAVRPALSDLKGRAVCATTPNGKGTDAYDFYLATLSKPDWKYFHWYTLDNPYIDPEEIEAAKREMDPISFRQEYMASWESFEGLAYYCFDENLHIKKQPPIEPEKPVILAFDFNVNPTTLLVHQRDGETIRFKKEYSQKNSSTPATVRTFCEDHKELAQKLVIKIRGDSSGNARKSVVGRSDYEAVKEMLSLYGFNYQYEVPSVNPSIIDRVANANGYLKNVYGQHRVEFDPTMKDTIRDLSSQELDGRFPSDRNNLGHKADAVGYTLWWESIHSKRKEQRTIEL